MAKKSNAYTGGYEICTPKEQVQAKFNIQLVRNCMESILKDMAVDGTSYQFCVRNRRVDTQDYLKDILVSEHGDEKLDDYVRRYNDMICENTSIGHNNFETKIYYIISYSAEIVEDENFNLTEAPEELRKAVLEACITYGNGFYKKKYKTLTGEKDNLLEDEKRTAYRKVEAEAERLKIYSKLEDMLDYASENFMHFEMFLSAMDRYMVYGELPQSRLKAVHIENDMDMIIKLSYSLDYAVRMKKKNKNIWLFVDGADELLYSTTGSDFIIVLLERTEKLHVPVTMVIDDPVHIFTNQDASIEFEYLLNKMNYFELFGLGPIERKQFIEKLNIADTLIPYIIDREPGEGIILTSTSNIAFTDRLGDEEHSFYKLFY